MKRVQLLSGNVLKIIGAIFMVIDHVGMIFFPGIEAFRAIGRIAFPIFAFFIAEGTRYTKNRKRYFLQIFVLGLICQVAILIFMPSAQLNVLITFALAILVCYALDNLKGAIILRRTRGQILWAGVYLTVIIAIIATLSIIKRMEYGTFGCLVPAFASIFYTPKSVPRQLRLDATAFHVLTTAIGVLACSIASGNPNQIFSLFSIPILLTYSGKRGRVKMKYFFYIFYPAHLAFLWILSFAIS